MSCASQEISPFMKSGASLPYSQKPVSGSYPEPHESTEMAAILSQMALIYIFTFIFL
jgi:hypothetical protein